MEDRVKPPYVAEQGAKSFVEKLQQEAASGSLTPELAQRLADKYRQEYPKVSVDPAGLLRGMDVSRVWADETAQWTDLMQRLATAKYGLGGLAAQAKSEPPLTKFKDHELIMELIKRGYAAMKMPDGGVPEVLK